MEGNNVLCKTKHLWGMWSTSSSRAAQNWRRKARTHTLQKPQAAQVARYFPCWNMYSSVSILSPVQHLTSPLSGGSIVKLDVLSLWTGRGAGVFLRLVQVPKKHSGGALQVGSSGKTYVVCLGETPERVISRETSADGAQGCQLARAPFFCGTFFVCILQPLNTQGAGCQGMNFSRVPQGIRSD
jgi:hypothetical protein